MCAFVGGAVIFLFLLLPNTTTSPQHATPPCQFNSRSKHHWEEEGEEGEGEENKTKQKSLLFPSIPTFSPPPVRSLQLQLPCLVLSCPTLQQPTYACVACAVMRCSTCNPPWGEKKKKYAKYVANNTTDTGPPPCFAPCMLLGKGGGGCANATPLLLLP